MEPGSLGAVLVYENLWAAGFASAVRHAGGQLVTQGRIPIQAIIAAIEADEAALVAEEGCPMPLRSSASGQGSGRNEPPSPRARRPSPRPPSLVPPFRSPGPHPIAKTAVVAAAITPRRRRF